MNATVLGCGRWGTYIAHYLNTKGHNVLLWGRKDSPRLKELIHSGGNEYMPLDKHIRTSTSLEIALNYADTVFISISSQHLRNLAKAISQYKIDGKTIVLCMKGIENNTGLRLTEVIKEECGDAVKTAVWVGPGHVQNFLKGIPSCMIIDSNSEELSKFLVGQLSSNLIRLYYGHDLIGTEIGAAAKNIVGIAAGMLDGLGYHSLKGALMARGASEFSKMVVAMGGQAQTIYGLSHLGDYEATLFSPYSHNRKFGEDFVHGNKFDKLAEGATTVKSFVMLSKKYNIELPIAKVIYSVIYENLDIRTGIMELFSRPLKHEFEK